MTGEALAILAAHGLQPGEIEPKRQLFDLVLRAFDQAAGGLPTHAWWVPGRLEVFGKHTDYCGGHSLVGTVPRGFAVAARARAGGVVALRDARRGEVFALDLNLPGVDRAYTGWRNHAHVVVHRLERNFPGALRGADLVFASDLPPASGMSSSSALMVGLATALGALAGIDERPEWRGSIRTPADQAGYYACVENGMAFGGLAGDGGVGTHGGSEDHLAIVCGRAGLLTQWRFVPIAHVADVAVPAGWTFAIASSGVTADKTGAAREAYNRLSSQASDLLERWRSGHGPAPSLGAALSADPSAARRLEQAVRSAGDPPETAEALGRRLAHFVREDGRVFEAVRAFQDADARGLGALSEASQADAEALLRNQVPETAALVRAGRSLGAFAASGFGAGFGGSVWALVESADAARFAARWLEGYRRAFPARTGALTFLARPGPGMVRVV